MFGFLMPLVIAVLIVLFPSLLLASAPTGSEVFAAKTIESFDTQSSELQLVNDAVLHKGEGIGSALLLSRNASAILQSKYKISASGGTITFWMRPNWESSDEESHVFLTMPWSDGKHGYMALSYGWWEPLGAHKLYLVVSNQEFVFCSTAYHFEPRTWTHVTARWQAGQPGQCSIYLNEDKVADNQVVFAGNYEQGGPLIIGSDRGATDQRNRTADFAFDELKIFDHPLTDREIGALYHADNTRPLLGNRTEWDWMKSTLSQPRAVTRAPDGTLLESRVVFDEGIQWAFSREVTDAKLHRLKKAGFNVYVPCVWHGKGAHFPTSVTDLDHSLVTIANGGYDPLKYLIDRAHSMGIEVHPWFTISRREWDKYPEFFPKGTPDEAYDVHNAAFRSFIVQLVLDMVERYDVDGVNLDYIRSMGLCTSDSCIKEYKQVSGRDLVNDISTRFSSREAFEHLQSWQDSAIADIVSRIAASARRIRPNIVLSIDGHPKPPNLPRPLDGRNELAWANAGWIDVIFAMDYRKRFDDAEFDAIRTDLEQPEKLFPLFGNFDMVDGNAVPRSGKLISRYFQFAQHRWPESGAGIFIFTQMNADQLTALRNGAFIEKARTKWPSREFTRRSREKLR